MLKRALFTKTEEAEEKVVYRPKEGTDIGYMFFDQVFDDVVGMVEEEEMPSKVVIVAEGMKKDDMEKRLTDYLKDLNKGIESCEEKKGGSLTHAIYATTGAAFGTAGGLGLSKFIDYLWDIVSKVFSLSPLVIETGPSILPVTIPIQLIGFGILGTILGTYTGLLRADRKYDKRIEEITKKLEVGDYILIE